MRLHVNFNEVDAFLEGKFIQTNCVFNTDFGEVFLVKTEDIYEGDYDIVPRVYQQVLNTKDKLMLNNVTVEVIPLSKVINLQNGYTVTIG